MREIKKIKGAQSLNNLKYVFARFLFVNEDNTRTLILARKELVFVFAPIVGFKGEFNQPMILSENVIFHLEVYVLFFGLVKLTTTEGNNPWGQSWLPLVVLYEH